jgi:hypothetical protein
MVRSRPRSTPFLAAFLAALLISVLSAGCTSVGTSADESSGFSSSRGTTIQKTLKPRPATGAARYLPDLSDASFAVESIDLAARPDPMPTAVGMIEQAIGDDQAPRYEVAGVEAANEAGQVVKTVQLTRTAATCLHQQGHLAMHAYVDTRHRYSMSIALVVRATTFKDIDVAWCALTSLVPYEAAPEPGGGSVPAIAPCVGQRRTGPALVTWVATTDVMCAALGDPVLPVERTLGRGDAGTDVARMQLALADLGADVRVDGRLGPATISAIRAFQDCFGVTRPRPGIADGATMNALTVAQTSGWTTEQCPP